MNHIFCFYQCLCIFFLHDMLSLGTYLEKIALRILGEKLQLLSVFAKYLTQIFDNREKGLVGRGFIIKSLRCNRYNRPNLITRLLRPLGSKVVNAQSLT